MIVKMKKLSAICQKEMSRDVLKKLYSLGCVELESASNELLDTAGEKLYTEEENTGSLQTKSKVSAAISYLDKYYPQKVSMFTPRDPVSEKQLFDEKTMKDAVTATDEITSFAEKIDENNTLILKTESRIMSLLPWESLNVPCEVSKTVNTVFVKGVIPAEIDMETLKNEISAQFSEYELDILCQDKEQYYVTVLCHNEIFDGVLSKLKAVGFMLAPLSDLKGSVKENIASLRQLVSNTNDENKELVEKIRGLAGKRKIIAASYDALVQESEKDSIISSSGKTKRTVLLTGWVPMEKQDDVGMIFEQSGCAWEFSDPSPDENVPVTYKTNALVEPFVGITEMYGTPSYDSVVDPNPLMSIFYFIFFGFMMGDAMYGVLIFLGCYIFLKLRRPEGSFKRMVKMFMYCGVSTFIAGALTGGWFADSVAVVSTWAFGKTVAIPPIWFDPLSNPMTMLAFSIVLGAIQLLTGMALAAYRMIKQGHPLDALFDVGSWWILFAGLGLLVLSMVMQIGSSTVATYVTVIGVLMLLLTGGRKNKGFGKITGGLGSLYGVTGYISDLLSYSRIMALGLSGAVVGQVVNKIATMSSGFIGIILFVAVFILGHVFNIAVCLLGAYVHAARLQYIEFFGKFFNDGGRAFRPLINNTKYVEIIKEEN